MKSHLTHEVARPLKPPVVYRPVLSTHTVCYQYPGMVSNGPETSVIPGTSSTTGQFTGFPIRLSFLHTAIGPQLTSVFYKIQKYMNGKDQSAVLPGGGQMSGKVKSATQ